MVVHSLGQGDPDVISGYVLQGRLGTGGMGAVYLSATRGGQPVAIKTVRPDLAMDPRFRQRFEREVQAARSVRGQYIANVVDSNIEGPMPWLATEYVPGVSLAQAISTHGSLPIRTCIGLAAGVADALETIHAARIIHRDLKPGNVVLTQSGLSVIDFGIARVLDPTSLTGTNTRIGTPAFMAPEQFKRDTPTTSAVDVFALGLTIHVAATGFHPFADELLAAIPYLMGGEPDLTDCPEPLRALIGSCLAMNPADRPEAAEVASMCREVGNRLGLTEVLPEAGWLPDQFTVVSVSAPKNSAIPPSDSAAPAPPAPAARKSRKWFAVGSAVLAIAGIASFVIWIGPWNGDSEGRDGAPEAKPSRDATVPETPVEKPREITEGEERLNDRVKHALLDCKSVEGLSRIPGANVTLSCTPKYGAGTALSESEANGISVRVASFPVKQDMYEFESFVKREEGEVQDDGERGEPKSDLSEITLSVNDFPYQSSVEDKYGARIGELFTHENALDVSTISWTFENDFYVDMHKEYFVVVAESKDREALVRWRNEGPII
ncbi:serine/threonine-protein kinase [Streptomyces sp. 796.1]|uniref:serine/threonine-protein kinase n=1 Tax=Streptomyces sp. 796.1 TaxID=3163029 RepID=UPI0039C8DE97